MHYQRTLFVFRQDLRIEDNTWLSHAYHTSKEVIPVFIFDEAILSRFPRPDRRIGFLVDTLHALHTQLEKVQSGLIVLHGHATQLIPLLMQERSCDALMQNRSYGTGALSRDQESKHRCAKHSKTYLDFADFLLVEPAQLPVRKVFTPFYRLRLEAEKKRPTYGLPPFSPLPQDLKKTSLNPYLGNLRAKKELLNRLQWSPISYRTPKLLTHLVDQLPRTGYEETRNRPDLQGTSQLSPYLRFGLISPRQVLMHVLTGQEAGVNLTETTISMDKRVFKDSFVSELAWREFWQHIFHFFPETRISAFQSKRRYIQRENDEELFAARSEARTGYPIIDAGLRQLHAMHRMHGRARMIVASFLTKDLLIDRRRWAQHFADYLLDYDEAVNTGNRQWSASVGADPKPLRIFNPVLQSKKSDPDAAYIHHRLPELKGYAPEQVHDPLTYQLNYASPIINHYERTKRAKQLYTKSASA